MLAPEFNFDLDTAPMLFIHGDADGWAAMNSVKAWEKMRAMGIQCELHYGRPEIPLVRPAGRVVNQKSSRITTFWNIPLYSLYFSPKVVTKVG